MIKQYGADSVRWFILSDSPPEKDVQWSDKGVISSSKFLQRIWNLNQSILNRVDRKIDNSEKDTFINNIDLYIFKIDSSINSFQFNVAIAQFYEVYKYFNTSINLELNNEVLRTHIIKIMKLMIPFVPHIAHECLTNLNCKEINKWPKVNDSIFKNLKINLVIQINGKTRDVLNLKKDMDEKEINSYINKFSKAKKYLTNNKIIKTIFVKNKIINYIVGK